MSRLMILPAKNITAIRLVEIPDDIEKQEAYRQVVGLIAQVEEENPEYDWDDIVSILEDHQINPVEFILGPHLD